MTDILLSPVREDKKQPVALRDDRHFIIAGSQRQKTTCGAS